MLGFKMSHHRSLNSDDHPLRVACGLWLARSHRALQRNYRQSSSSPSLSTSRASPFDMDMGLWMR